MKPRHRGSYTKWRIAFTIDRPIVYRDYTGKLVKTIVAKASPRLAEELAARRRAEPKPLSLSPIYTAAPTGGVRAVYPYTWKPGAETSPVTLHPGNTYWFHIAAEASLQPEIHTLIMRLLAGHTIPTRTGPATLTLEAAEQIAAYTPANPETTLQQGQCIKITLLSPTLPTTPYHPQSRIKRLTTSPIHLLAVNLLTLYRRPDPQAIAALDLLTPSPTATRTTKTTWYQYNDKTLPALIGYIKYRVDDTVEATGDQLETLNHIISHARTTGAGSGRAAGFGDLEITPRETC